MTDVLEPLLRTLNERLRAARTPAEKSIHDLRVATKRLREGVRVFKPVLGKKNAKKNLEWIEDLNDALGRVRDLDVLQSKLRRIPRGPAAPLRALISRLESDRAGAARLLESLLRRHHDAELGARLMKKLRRLGTKKSCFAESLQPLVACAILDRVDAVMDAWDDVSSSALPEAFHRARIQNRRLRYVISAFSDWLPPAVRHVEKRVDDLHDALGDFHDEVSLLRVLETEAVRAAPRDRSWWIKRAREAERRRQTDFETVLNVVEALRSSGWPSLREALGG